MSTNCIYKKKQIIENNKIASTKTCSEGSLSISKNLSKEWLIKKKKLKVQK